MKNILGFVFVSFSLLTLSACSSSPESSSSQVCAGARCRAVSLAQTPAQQAKGLMGVSELASDQGMLFVFSVADRYAFWMKNTVIPLDIVWIDEAFRVVHLEQASPCLTEVCPTYTPDAPARRVLELASGQAQEAGLKV